MVNKSKSLNYAVPRMECSLHGLLILLILWAIFTRTKCWVSAEGAGEVLKGGVGERPYQTSLEKSFLQSDCVRVAVLIVSQGHLALLVQLSSVSHACSWGTLPLFLSPFAPEFLRSPVVGCCVACFILQSLSCGHLRFQDKCERSARAHKTQ